MIVVDDGSTDGSCEGIVSLGARVIRHVDRLGVAYCRNEASRLATGEVFCYLDGHQRLSPQCIDRCAELAVRHRAIVSPDVCGRRNESKPRYGATFRLCPKNGYFSAKWEQKRPTNTITRSTSVRAPGYVMSRETYQELAWMGALRGWGGSEAAVSLKAFFLDIDILQLHGPIAYHLFRKQFPYETTWHGIWRNHAIIARVCFDDRSWFEHWLPNVFDEHLTDEAREDLKSEEVLAEHEAFLAKKIRTDRQFWRILLRQSEPSCLRR